MKRERGQKRWPGIIKGGSEDIRDGKGSSNPRGWLKPTA